MRHATSMVLALAVCSAASCGDDLPFGDDADDGEMVVSVLRWNWETSCWKRISSADPDSDLSNGDEPYGREGRCGEEAIGETLTAGRDRLMIIVDYGTKIEISPGTELPKPAIAVTLDGVPSTTQPAIGGMQRSGRHLFFVATYEVPLAAVAELRIAAQATADFGDDTAESFRVDYPAPTITFEGCPDPCIRRGGVDLVDVVITIPSQTAQTATLRSRLTAGGAEDSREVTTVVEGQAVTRRRITMLAPMVGASSTWQFELDWRTQHDGRQVTVRPPDITLSVAECPIDQGAECQRDAAVGKVGVTVTVPGAMPQSVILRSVVDGFDDNVQTKTSGAGDGTFTEARFDVPVPDRTTDAWTLEARWQLVDASFGPITLIAPGIDLDWSCPDAGCQLEVGSTVAVFITAPMDIHSTDATYSTSADSVPLLGNVVLNASVADQAQGSRTWSGTLTVPDRVGQAFQVDARVAGYRSNSRVGTIIPAPEEEEEEAP